MHNIHLVTECGHKSRRRASRWSGPARHAFANRPTRRRIRYPEPGAGADAGRDGIRAAGIALLRQVFALSPASYLKRYDMTFSEEEGG